MIVCCPACRSQYRYQESVSDAGGQAVCANCEGLVPLVAARRAYVLRAQVTAVPARVAAGSGLDAPGLASDLKNTAFEGKKAADRPPLAYRVTAPEPALATEPDTSPYDHSVEVSASPEMHPVDGLALEAQAPVETEAPAGQRGVAADDKKVAAPKGRGAGRGVLELLVIVILAAAGAAAGEYATMVGWLGPVWVHSAVQPVRLGIIGGLLGVLIAWAGIRWTTRKS